MARKRSPSTPDLPAQSAQPDAQHPPRTASAWRDADALAELLEGARVAPLRSARMTPERVDELVEAARAGRIAK